MIVAVLPHKGPLAATGQQGELCHGARPGLDPLLISLGFSVTPIYC